MDLQVLKYDSADCPGYAYIKIYNRNATKENMIRQLKQTLGIEKTINFGSIPEKHDVIVKPGDRNYGVYMLKKCMSR